MVLDVRTVQDHLGLNGPGESLRRTGVFGQFGGILGPFRTIWADTVLELQDHVSGYEDRVKRE